MSTLRVLIADDHPVFRHGIRALLEATQDTNIVGEATSGDEVIALAEEVHPDVILMDVRMPGVNGIDATRRILRVLPQVRVLVVTMFEDDSSVFAAMRAGARGYVLKEATNEEIVQAIRTVGNGGAIFSPAIATRLIAFFAQPHFSIPKTIFPELTDREREILDLLARGQSTTEIASRLSLSGKTISNYISNILAKLQVIDRTEAIVRARDAGLGKG